MELTLVAALALSMMPLDMALFNARTTLHLAGFYGASVGCSESYDGYVCAAKIKDGYVILRCAGHRAEPCTANVVRKGKVAP